MASMVFIPHNPQITNASGGNTNTATRKVPRVQGWAEGAGLKVTRVCSNPSCVNMLEHNWPSKRCAPCREMALRQRVNLPCSVCSVTPLSVTLREARSGKQFICSPCWQGMNTRIRALQPIRPAPEGMPPPSPQTRQPPATPPAAPPAPMPVVEQTADVFELVKQFVHPDHRHILQRRDGHDPCPPIKSIPLPSVLSYDEARRRVESIMPHYGLRGEIIAITPEDLQMERPARSSVPVPMSNRQVVAEPVAVQRTGARSRHSSESIAVPQLSKLAPVTPAQEPSSKVNETRPVADPKPTPAMSDAPPRPVRKKRKRALAPVPPATGAERVCAAPGCVRMIPAKFQGVLCVQCGFARWQNQFRERFSALRTALSVQDKIKENKAPAHTKEPIAAAVVGAPEASARADAVAVGAVPRKADATGSQAEDNRSPPTRHRDAPLPLAHMAPEQSRQMTERHPDAMDVDHNSSDDEPLSTKSRGPPGSKKTSQVAMAVDPLSSDEEPLSVMVAQPVTSDEEPLSAMFHDYTSSDEEPLAKVVSARPAGSPQKLSATHAASGASSATYAPLRIVIPPAVHPTPSRIRRVRLILGPRPATPASSSSSRDSSPERSPDTSCSSTRRRRRTSSAIDQRWLALGWDSDESELTPLEDSTDEGESEVEPAESEDEVSAPVAVTAAPGSSPTEPKKHPASPTGKKHRGQCATPQCGNLLAPGWKWKCCDVCRLRTRILRKQERRAGREELEEFELPSNGDFTGWRKCSMSWCKRMLPEQYRWKMCPRCRATRRRRWHMSKHGQEGLPDDEALLFAEGMHAAQRAAASGGMVGVVEASPDKDQVPETLEDLPAYQHFAALLETLSLRFDDFKAAQMRYVQLKALQGADRKPMVFGFDGEYSIVADPSGGSVDAMVNTVIRDLSLALNLVFTLVTVRAGPEESIIAALRCLYQPRIPALRTQKKAEPEPKLELDPAQPKKSAAVAVAMTGDLDITVAWDRRHKFFPGQRIMVRFRLVG
ncbi:hypothetical protein K466DRAFT_559658 [Polyporus arcularius HHB13444]|uniref:Uncharacterized protein n=1 Tax=Polyporus arcularius HHB13444 TaxID=1314778 RepID=A0A5C3NQX9_9APHY|nr:hypothetical protein K466DRAFT_559658 [Polyporus arcularius HHB13444]